VTRAFRKIKLVRKLEKTRLADEERKCCLAFDKAVTKNNAFD